MPRARCLCSQGDRPRTISSVKMSWMRPLSSGFHCSIFLLKDKIKDSSSPLSRSQAMKRLVSPIVDNALRTERAGEWTGLSAHYDLWPKITLLMVLLMVHDTRLLCFDGVRLW